MLYKNILVPYDKSAPAFAALEEAIRFAQEDSETTLRIVEMVKAEAESQAQFYDESRHRRGRGFTNPDQELAELEDETMMDAMLQMRATLRERVDDLANNVIVETVATGNPSEEIITYAVEHDCDAIVMGSRGRSGLRALGSVSRPVVAHAPMPVIIVKSKA